jgi:hypothetical protein
MIELKRKGSPNVGNQTCHHSIVSRAIRKLLGHL